MKPTTEPLQSQRLLTVLFAVAVGLAIVGFLVGTRPADKAHRAKPTRAQKPPADKARSYTQLRKDRATRAASKELSGLLAAVPKTVPKSAPTAAQRHAAIAARARRRAFNGAPPVIPHGVTEKSSAACLTCHRAGAVVNGKIAAPISHPAYASCTQCHVASHGIGKRHVSSVSNSFRGARTAGRGTRSGIGAPPTIPHATWMRSRCLACHGPAGKPGLRTTHPQRVSCRQCHAPNQRRHPAAGIPR